MACRHGLSRACRRRSGEATWVPGSPGGGGKRAVAAALPQTGSSLIRDCENGQVATPRGPNNKS